ncbi:uncharacterized protein LOC119642710 [Glossina fuscipes]|uniref:Uncharacterized protein LOC119642710 n=1 Tax=Glossina fuscipes TaxID=7396 RepID=A0A9C5ZA38_9MUSC|nr:uncharacterized protein LOC119642710 [Glossina fuscipes]
MRTKVINKKGEESRPVALKKSVGRYEDEIISLVDSRPYARTTITNFDNLTSSQKSCHELLSQSVAELSTSGYEFHISDEELIECCTKAEDTMKEVKNIEAPEEKETIVDVVFEDSPEGGEDNKKKTIVDIIFEDFSTSPFNSPVVSPENKLRNLERSPLYILREKPRKNYSRDFREKAQLALLYDYTPERKASDRGYTEKEETYNVNQSKLFLKSAMRQYLN